MPPKRPKKKFAQTPDSPHKEIEVFPSKTFFVDMLTRDIDLADAILDLLDNCVDGVRRLVGPASFRPGTQSKPYSGYWADIRYGDQQFSIRDNCGGIPLQVAIEYAFKFGKPAIFSPASDGTIGLVGIGMKRAILKIGRSCLVHSHHAGDTFNVKITPEWLKEDNDWKLHYERTKPLFR